MRNIAIIGASYLQLPLIEKAKELGYVTHVFAWAANDVGEVAADYFYPISITEKDKIVEECKKIGICGICSIATDLGNITVNYVAEKLGLVGNGIDATKKSTNKHLMRKAFLYGGDPSPFSVIVDNVDDYDNLRLTYPVIVKPTDRSGSRGICKVDDHEKLKDAIQAALSVSFEKKVVIEEFVSGVEYSVEGLSYKGEHHVLAMTLKHTTGEPSFIETGHLEPAPVSKELFEKVSKVVIHALDTLGIQNGASHSEIKIDDDGSIMIIEIGSRMGGDFIGSDLVYYSTGIDYLKAVIQVACGEAPDLTPCAMTCSAEVRFILTKQDLLEYRRVQKYEAERLLKVVDDKHFDMIGKTTDSSNRAGCYIVKM